MAAPQLEKVRQLRTLRTLNAHQEGKMQAHSRHLCTADVTAIVIAAAGGAMAVVTAAASAIVADIQSDRSLGKADAAIGSVRNPGACGSLQCSAK